MAKEEAKKDLEQVEAKKDLEQVETTADEVDKDAEKEEEEEEDDSSPKDGKRDKKGSKKEPAERTSLLHAKAYKDHVEELVKNTPVRISDFDPRAVKLLDIFHQRGGGDKVKQATDSVASSIAGLQREEVSNWRAYIYTLLKGVDPDAYRAMKESAEVVKALRDTIEDRKPRTERSSQAPRGGAQRPPTGGKGKGKGKGKVVEEERRGSGKFKLASYEFNTTAAEFVPGAEKYVPVNEKVKVKPIQVADAVEYKGTRNDRRRKSEKDESTEGSKKGQDSEAPADVPLAFGGLCPCRRKAKVD